MAFAAVMFTQCGNKTAQNRAPAEEEDTISVVENEIMVFGICGEGSAMNTLEVITDTGDTLNLSLEKAKEEGHVYGGYSVGDRIAVYLQKKDNEPLVVINETTLMGNWLMPNPIDGSSTLGMSIKDGGIAESINQPTIICKTWKIQNHLVNFRIAITTAGNYFSSVSIQHRSGSFWIMTGRQRIPRTMIKQVAETQNVSGT